MLKHLKPNLPPQYERYHEPFLGGGALFFDLEPEWPVLNDSNRRLMAFYSTLQDPTKLEQISEDLEELRTAWPNATQEQREQAYYIRRNIFNDIRVEPSITLAVCLLFLNKAGFNGLYRTNGSGKFNVPVGRYKNLGFPSYRQLKQAHLALAAATLNNVDFELALLEAQPGDFVYCDPPYYPVKDGSFTQYNSDDFGRGEQERLAESLDRLHRLGVQWMLSQSDVRWVQSRYKRYHQQRIEARRAINSKGSGRGPVYELLITNYEPG